VVLRFVSIARRKPQRYLSARHGTSSGFSGIPGSLDGRRANRDCRQQILKLADAGYESPAHCTVAVQSDAVEPRTRKQLRVRGISMSELDRSLRSQNGRWDITDTSCHVQDNNAMSGSAVIRCLWGLINSVMHISAYDLTHTIRIKWQNERYATAMPLYCFITGVCSEHAIVYVSPAAVLDVG
jgi:hypothetical protein